ncbi:uncharacterized protein METZ01_LOCUS106623, partial [marine metagenome]
VRQGAYAVVLTIIAVGFASSLSPQAAQPLSGSAPAAVSPQRALLDEYCVTCHNG